MLLNLSWPAVSHSCSLTLKPARSAFLEMKNAPVEDVVGLNLSLTYRSTKLVFPTPEGKKKGVES